MDNIFIPSLNDAQQDILDKPEDKIAYLVSFSLINPGFTSETLEKHMVSLSSIIANNYNNMDNAVEVYQQKLQDLISSNCPEDNYNVYVTNVVDPTNATVSSFQIIVTDRNNINIFNQTHMIDLLKIKAPQ